MDLIDRKALRDAIVKRAGLEWDLLKVCSPILEEVEKASTVEERETATWLYSGMRMECSGCGAVYRYGDLYGADFCPCCGADMR